MPKIICGYVSVIMCVKSSPSSVCVNKVLLEYCTLICLCIVCGWLHTVMADLISCHRDNTACKAYHIYYQALCRKRLVTPDSVDVIIIIFFVCLPNVRDCGVSHYLTYVVYLIKLAQWIYAVNLIFIFIFTVEVWRGSVTRQLFTGQPLLETFLEAVPLGC